MARRILNRKEMRADFDAAERKKEDEETDETEDETEDEDEDEEEEEGEAGDKGDDEEGDDEGDEGDDEDAPKKKKKKKVVVPKAKAKAKPRSRAAKVVRMKVIWGVFDNSNRRVAVYDYPKRAEADAHAKKLSEDKKSTHFVQPVKEPLEEAK